jgi:hypothetical protein
VSGEHQLEVRIGSSWCPTSYKFPSREEADAAIIRCAELQPNAEFRVAAPRRKAVAK